MRGDNIDKNKLKRRGDNVDQYIYIYKEGRHILFIKCFVFHKIIFVDLIHQEQEYGSREVFS